MNECIEIVRGGFVIKYISTRVSVFSRNNCCFQYFCSRWRSTRVIWWNFI